MLVVFYNTMLKYVQVFDAILCSMHVCVMCSLYYINVVLDYHNKIKQTNVFGDVSGIKTKCHQLRRFFVFS